MSDNLAALIAASAGVAVGHAVLPDHWVPMAVLGRTRRYSLTRIAKLSALAGVAHVLVSVVLGAVIVLIELQFRSTVQSAQDAIVGGLLIATGVGFVVLELSGRGHHHGLGGHSHSHGDHDHDHDHDEHSREPEHSQSHHDHPDSPGDRRGLRGLAAVMVPFGAAASPDLTILPVFLAATTAGVASAVSSLAVFAVVTIGTIVGLTLVAARGGYQLRGQWLERWGNAFTALVLVVIGLLVLFGVI
jgi:nickel/cobalt transporter (NicO) family protein